MRRPVILNLTPRFLAILLLIATAASQIAAAPVPSLPAQQDLLLPDLETLPPYDLRLIVQDEGRRKILRFSNSIWNRGPGILEMRGRRDLLRGTVAIRQVVFRPDGSFIEEDRGELQFHPEHRHWHWLEFSRYEIWSVTPLGLLGRLLLASGKVGYCLRDDERLLAAPLGPPLLEDEQVRNRPFYHGCDWERQGISVGWRDTYDYNTGGQSLELSALPDGLYALKSTVDPGNLLQELDKANNTAVVFFGIYGNRLVVFGVTPPLHIDPGGYRKLQRGGNLIQ